MNKLATLLIFIVFLVPSSITFAEDGYKFYGAIKASVNSTNDGSETELSVSNNSTRVGLKGNQQVKDNLDVIYQIELGVDNTERAKIDSGRNTYIGLKGNFGRVMVGQHDTPYKDIRDHGAELFNDTIAGSRSIISAVADAGGAKIDNRVKNAIMYYSPTLSGSQLFVLYSTDNQKTPDTPDNNENDLISASAIYKEGPIYLGLGLEKKSNPGSDDTESIRLVARYKFAQFQVGGIIESADNGNNNSLTRDAAAVNARYNLDSKTWIGIQIAMAEDYDGSSNTGGTNISLGIEHKLAKPTSVYAVLSMTQNDDNAAFGLSQGGIQDTVVAAINGEDVRGASVGIVHKF